MKSELGEGQTGRIGLDGAWVCPGDIGQSAVHGTVMDEFYVIPGRGLGRVLGPSAAIVPGPQAAPEGRTVRQPSTRRCEATAPPQKGSPPLIEDMPVLYS